MHQEHFTKKFTACNVFPAKCHQPAPHPTCKAPVRCTASGCKGCTCNDGLLATVNAQRARDGHPPLRDLSQWGVPKRRRSAPVPATVASSASSTTPAPAVGSAAGGAPAVDGADGVSDPPLEFDQPDAGAAADPPGPRAEPAVLPLREWLQSTRVKTEPGCGVSPSPSPPRGDGKWSDTLASVPIDPGRHLRGVGARDSEGRLMVELRVFQPDDALFGAAADDARLSSGGRHLGSLSDASVRYDQRTGAFGVWIPIGVTRWDTWKANPSPHANKMIAAASAFVSSALVALLPVCTSYDTAHQYGWIHARNKARQYRPAGFSVFNMVGFHGGVFALQALPVEFNLSDGVMRVANPGKLFWNDKPVCSFRKAPQDGASGLPATMRRVPVVFRHIWTCQQCGRFMIPALLADGSRNPDADPERWLDFAFCPSVGTYRDESAPSQRLSGMGALRWLHALRDWAEETGLVLTHFKACDDHRARMLGA
eukprot:gene8735-2229_t